MTSHPLPKLPRILDKKEAKITPKILQWFSEHYPRSVVLEIKATKTNTISPSAVTQQQIKALLASRSKKGLPHKMSDAGRVRQPFDGFVLKKTHSFVVACFLKHGICLAIHPKEWKGAKIDSPCAFSFKI